MSEAPAKVVNKSIHLYEGKNGRCTVLVYVDGKVSASYSPSNRTEADTLVKRLADNDCPKCGDPHFALQSHVHWTPDGEVIWPQFATLLASTPSGEFNPWEQTAFGEVDPTLKRYREACARMAELDVLEREAEMRSMGHLPT